MVGPRSVSERAAMQPLDRGRRAYSGRGGFWGRRAWVAPSYSVGLLRLFAVSVRRGWPQSGRGLSRGRAWCVFLASGLNRTGGAAAPSPPPDVGVGLPAELPATSDQGPAVGLWEG